MFSVSENNPFPVGMRGDNINGAVCELELDGGSTSRFLVVLPQKYNYHRLRSMMAKGVSEFDARPLLTLLGYSPSEEVFWLYHLMIFEVDKQYLSSQSLFFENRKNFQEYAFEDINEVLDFCKVNYNVSVADFKKDWETNYPQY